MNSLGISTWIVSKSIGALMLNVLRAQLHKQLEDGAEVGSTGGIVEGTLIDELSTVK
jgi:hypothetical protein